MNEEKLLIGNHERVLVTGSNGFIGSRVVENLIHKGYHNIRCFVRPSSDIRRLNNIIHSHSVEILSGNLLSNADCRRAVEGVAVIFHLAAGIEKSFPGSFLNSVVTTRNLLDAVRQEGKLQRFLNVSSFSVYTNRRMKRRALLDENCELEDRAVDRAEAYCYGKLKQDELTIEYGNRYRIPYVIVRPGAVYGPGKPALTARVGIDTFGFFMHIGGNNQLPLTYVDNCAEAMVLAGLTKGVDGEIFNVVDDDLPTSREFLRQYKKYIPIRSLYFPYPLFYFFCYLWEKYSKWSEGQLPSAFNRYRCSAYWKGNTYSNQKLKEVLGWKPVIPYDRASSQFFANVSGVGER